MLRWDTRTCEAHLPRKPAGQQGCLVSLQNQNDKIITAGSRRICGPERGQG